MTEALSVYSSYICVGLFKYEHKLCLFGSVHHPIHIRVKKSVLGKCIVAQKTLNALKYEDPHLLRS